MNNNSTTHDPSLSRRDFLKIGWGILGGLVVLESGGIALGFSLPRVAAGQFGGTFTCGKVEDFPLNSVTPFNEGRFYLVRQTDGGFLALYRKCTHLGCAVPWDASKKQFICPCHASAFDQQGAVINPPAPRPLDRFIVKIENGQVLVDTAEALQRDKTNPTDATRV